MKAILILFCLIFGLNTLCSAHCSLYFYPGNRPGFGDPNTYSYSSPVRVKNWLYVYTYTQEERGFHLWRTFSDGSHGLPSDPNSLNSFDPNIAWNIIDTTEIYNPATDPNTKFTALGSYKDFLYVALKRNQTPDLWRHDSNIEDPNIVDWEQMGPENLTSGQINALSVFNDRLYMGITNPKGSETQKVTLWRFTKPDNQTPDSILWESIDCTQISANENTMISFFQELEDVLYLGTKNIQRGCEIWSLSKDSKLLQNLTPEGMGRPRTDNSKIAAMAVAGNILYAVTQNNHTGSQLWQYKQQENIFSEAPSSMWPKDPNQTNPLAMEGLGSYLFLGFDIGKIWRLNSRDNPLQIIPLNDTSHPFYDANQPILGENNNFSWLYADQNNGYLYLGTQNTGTSNVKGFTLWKSSQLPFITISGPQPPLNAFHDENLGLTWKTTKSGYYQINLTEFKDPNGFSDPNKNNYLPCLIDPNSNIIEASSPTLTSIKSSDLEVGGEEARDGEYTITIAWDPNRNLSQKDKETYPVWFSFLYDTTDPSIPTIIKVSPGNEKLNLQWTEAVDKLSGVAGYKIDWQAIEDPNEPAFITQYSTKITVETEYTVQTENGQQYIEYTIGNLINDQKYIVAISAMDYAGNESDRSVPLFGKPEPGQGLTDLSGETGGCFLKSLHEK